MFQVQVQKRKELVSTFNFHVFKGENKSLTINMFDIDTHNYSQLLFSKVQGKVPSTLLSRFFNVHHQNELQSLENRCVGTIQNGNFTPYTEDESNLFGLVNAYSSFNDYAGVQIEDSISMKAVLDIIGTLGYSIECEYDADTNRMKEIKLYREVS